MAHGLIRVDGLSVYSALLSNASTIMSQKQDSSVASNLLTMLPLVAVVVRRGIGFVHWEEVRQLRGHTVPKHLTRGLSFHCHPFAAVLDCHFTAVHSHGFVDVLVDVENEDWAGLLNNYTRNLLGGLVRIRDGDWFVGRERDSTLWPGESMIGGPLSGHRIACVARKVS